MFWTIIAPCIFAIPLYLVVHEGDHFLYAFVLRGHPKLRFSWKSIATNHDFTSGWKFRLVSEAGFGSALIVGGVMTALALLEVWTKWVTTPLVLAYWVVLTVHFWLYPWIATDKANDFNGMCSHNK